MKRWCLNRHLTHYGWYHCRHGLLHIPVNTNGTSGAAHGSVGNLGLGIAAVFFLWLCVYGAKRKKGQEGFPTDE